MNAFLALLQKKCLPGVWSRGVSIARSRGVHRDQASAAEQRFRVQPEGQAVASRVTLWPPEASETDSGDEGDYHCDCSERADPCSHVAACVAALRSGGLEQTSPGPSARVVYRLTRHSTPQGTELRLERCIAGPAGESPLIGSLVSHVGGTGSGRISSGPIAATQADFGVDRALGPGGATGSAGYDRTTWERLLDALREIDDLRLEDRPIRAGRPYLGLEAEVIEESGGYRLRLMQMDDAAPEIFRPGLILLQGTLRLLEDPGLTADERRLLEPPGRWFGPRELPWLVSEIVPALEHKIPVHIRSARLPRADDSPPILVLETSVDGSPGDERLRISPRVAYASEYSRRDLKREEDLARDLRLELQLALGQSVTLSGDEARDWVLRAERERERWRVHGPGVERFRMLGGLRAVSPRGSSTPIEFELSGQTRGTLRVPATDVLHAWRSGRPSVAIREAGQLVGWADLPRDWLGRFGDRAQEVLEAWAHARGSPPAWARLDAADLLVDSGQTPAFDHARLRAMLEHAPAAADTPPLQADLRSYQREGIAWLERLRELQLGAILADDMGLGKTLQAIAVARAPALVVCPTSVLRSWQEQIGRFRPDLGVSLYHGPGRELASKPAGVVLTSYSILRLDLDRLVQIPWQTIVLDESQTIRNPESQAARAAFRLAEARPNAFRLLLTGTPLENRLDDLWSQVRFANPGYLGALEDFRERYGHGDPVRTERLRRRLKLILLRRRKSEVAAELPPRTESLLYCELSDTERELYMSVLVAGRAQAVASLETGGDALSALELLLRLRQASCHPALVPGQSAESSAKLEQLVETLSTTLASGSKALVFSQWTSFLDLIGSRLTQEGISWERLDGSTRDRGAVVSRFQSDSGPPVLLLSLKAGGVGLTLTAADQVILCDPWWNPAVEDQAADRAHRIGQTRPVLIQRLVAAGTVEEKLLALQARKRELAAALIDGTDGDGAAAGLALTRQDLLDLLDAG